MPGRLKDSRDELAVHARYQRRYLACMAREFREALAENAACHQAMRREQESIEEKVEEKIEASTQLLHARISGLGTDVRRSVRNLVLAMFSGILILLGLGSAAVFTMMSLHVTGMH